MRCLPGSAAILNGLEFVVSELARLWKLPKWCFSTSIDVVCVLDILADEGDSIFRILGHSR